MKIKVSQKLIWCSLIVAGSALSLTACGSSDPNREQAPAANAPAAPTAQEIMAKPVELTVYYTGRSHTDQQFMDLYGSFIQKKYPQVSFKLMVTKDAPTIAELAATKTKVDFFYGQHSNIKDLADAGYINYDISGLLKTHKIATDKVNPTLYKYNLDSNGGILNPLPIAMIHLILVYNKDLFDKFGVPYVKNNMTWDDVYEVARKLTRLDGSTQYLGFGFQSIGSYLPGNQYGAPMINPTTQKAALNGEAWNKMFRQFSKFFEIPGNSYLASTPTFNAITQEKRLAMNIGLNSQAVGATYASGNYDFVNLPSFTDTAKGIGVVSSATFVAVGSTSDRKEQALLAMTTLLSPEVQTDRARSQGSFPVVEIANLSQVLASEVDAVKG
ncbi:MAG: hypothetical protein K0Q73_3813, partial [Paenibacillus sp.]|nr:hypothetical protein [Paenibacillus sp.]